MEESICQFANDPPPFDMQFDVSTRLPYKEEPTTKVLRIDL